MRIIQHLEKQGSSIIPPKVKKLLKIYIFFFNFIYYRGKSKVVEFFQFCLVDIIPSDKIHGFFIDSLPTMLDRSGPKNLAPGERTYLMISPDSELECPRKTSSENVSSSSSGSNYLALKTTDDMFKGGIEQSNPSEDKIAEPDTMRKTTTEWRVINVLKLSENRTTKSVD